MEPIITIRGSKGGTGTSTITALLAQLVTQHTTGPVLVIDHADDIASVMGCDRIGTLEDQLERWTDGASRVFIARHTNTIGTISCAVETIDYAAGAVEAFSDSPPVILYDAGIDAWTGTCYTLTVITNDYLSLRAYNSGPGSDAVILVEEPGRALMRKDVSHIVTDPIAAVIARHPDIARAGDAGTINIRLPKVAASALEDVARTIVTETRAARAAMR